MMSRKHYVVIAGIIKDNTIKGSQSHMIPLINKVKFISMLGSMFKEDNNNFDANRFISACYDDNE